jgi:hypothetical protein
MRHVKVQFIPAAFRSLLANPLADLGPEGETRVQEVRNVPDDVSNADLLRLWDQTCDATWLGDGAGRLSFEYGELAPGKIILE